jgi:hypothetical protein
MSEHTPDNWVILRIFSEKKGKPFYRVLGGWSGGYSYGSSWRMNSGIVACEENDKEYLFYGASGSTYRCKKSSYGLRMNMAGSGIYGLYDEDFQPFNGEYKKTISVMPETTKWTNVEWNLEETAITREVQETR